MSSVITAIEDDQLRVIKPNEREDFIAATYEHLPILALPVCYEKGNLGVSHLKVQNVRFSPYFGLQLLCYNSNFYRYLIIVCDRVDALSSVLANLEIYRQQTEQAKQQGADIIVFPEVRYKSYKIHRCLK